MLYLLGNIFLPFWAEFVIASSFASTNIAGILNTCAAEEAKLLPTGTRDARRIWGAIMFALVLWGESFPHSPALSWHTKVIAIVHASIAMNQKRRITQKTFQFLAGFSWVGMVDLLMKDHSPSGAAFLCSAWITAMCMLVTPFLSISDALCKRPLHLFDLVSASRSRSLLQATSGATDLCSIVLVLLLFVQLSPDSLVSLDEVVGYVVHYVLRGRADSLLDEHRSRVLQILVLCIANQLVWVAIKKIFLSSAPSYFKLDEELRAPTTDSPCVEAVGVVPIEYALATDAVVRAAAATATSCTTDINTADRISAGFVMNKERSKTHRFKFNMGGFSGRHRSLSAPSNFLPTVVLPSASDPRDDRELIATSIQNLGLQHGIYVHQYQRPRALSPPVAVAKAATGEPVVALAPTPTAPHAPCIGMSPNAESAAAVLLGENISEEEAISVIQQGLWKVKAKRAV